MHGRTIFKNASKMASSNASSSISLTSSATSSSAPTEPCNSGFDELVVAYDDNTFALVVKPQGLATLGEGRSLGKSAALKDGLVPSTALDALTKGRPVHRLDAPTGGLVIIAKTHSAVSTLGAALA
jgi:23S rRNA-/tRNA-specific pseudouridylate synthase